MNKPAVYKPRILTGDTPTGRLHLGHWVGSLENRVAMQNSYECFFIIANVHAFTTRAERPDDIRQSVLEIATDYLACGIDPNVSTIFLQSEIPAIAELTFFFAMLVPFARLMRNPTLKDEIRDKGLGDSYSFGFLLYPVGQIADILAFRPDMVPVGEDQMAHLELSREVARRFDQMYCGVDPQTPDKEYVAAARLRGEGGLYIMVAEILPNVTTPIIVESTVRLGYAIFTAATLSFLSLGIQQPSPDWGLTISLGRQYLQIAPWIVLFPALALATLVVGVNLIADSIQQVVGQ